jgi:hypothetical protein
MIFEGKSLHIFPTVNMGAIEDQIITDRMGNSCRKIQQRNIVDKEKNDFQSNLFNDH